MTSQISVSLSARRAWIEMAEVGGSNQTIMSLSARRAWIEMLESKQIDPSVMVALRKESVDRNKIGIVAIDGIIESLSARRAWIEMSKL